MNRFRYTFPAALLLVVGLVASARADDSVLNMVPRDTGAFLHVRVADVWNHDSTKSAREYLTKTEPRLLKELEKEVGFVPADVESLTLIIPGFGTRDLVAPPLIVVRTIKPFDKAKVLTALRAVTPSQFHDWDQPRYDLTPIPHPKFGPPPVPKDFPPPPPLLPREPVQFDGLQFVQFEAQKPRDVFEHVDPYILPPKPDLRARHYIIRNGNTHLYVLDDRTVAFAMNDHRSGGEALLALCTQMLRRAEKGPLDSAIAEAKKRTFVAAVNVELLAKSLPEKLPADAEHFRPFLAAKSAILSLDLGDDLKAVLAVEARNAADAKKIEDGVHALIGMAKEALPELKKQAKKSPTSELALLLLDQGEKALAKAAVDQKDGIVRVTTSIKPDVAWDAALKTAMAQLQIARERSISMNNLKQLGIGVHNYESVYRRLPFPGTGKGGAPLGPGNMNPNLSWRVALLPYIEQNNLYQAFKLDEPWDSEHNKKLIERMPKIFAPVNGVKADKGHTFYQIFTGREAMKSGMSLAAMPDGTSNTLMIVESGDAVPWTRPEDMLYDAKKPLPKLGGLFGGDFNAAFCDGSVRFIRKSTPEKVLRALITPAGGEVIDNDWDK